MNSDCIKVAVAKINNLIVNGDTKFRTTQGRLLGTNLLLHFIANFEEAPTTAAAMVQFLTDKGFKFSSLKGGTYNTFMRMFGPRIEQFSPNQIEQLRRIAKKLMSN